MAAPRTILHVDMDAFFAAIEQRDHPEWRGRPVIVGAPPDARGVVSTCSYEARRHGVRSAMPSRTAHRLCPEGIFVPVDGAKYRAVSAQIHALFERYTPLVEPVSVDEAFLDITGSQQLFGGALALARQLKAEILATVQLTASVGLAPNKFLAKVASDLHKPDGLTVCPADAAGIAAFLAPLPVGRLWGVGKRSEEVLHRAGLRTIGDLQRSDEARLVRLLGDAGGRHAWRLAHGWDDRPVSPGAEEKSISHEHTYATDEPDWTVVEATLRDLAGRVGQRLRAHHKLAATAHLKLRWADFTTITRQAALPGPTHHDAPLLAAAAALLAAARQPRPVRLIGFGVSDLAAPTADLPLQQPDLFDPTAPERDARQQQLDHALDAIRARFGQHSIRRGPPPNAPE